MIPGIMFAGFFLLLLAGVPIAVTLGLAGTAAIAGAGLGLFAVPANVTAGIGKYALLTIPMFVLAGAVFERAGIAQRLVDLSVAIFGNGRGALAAVAIFVCLNMGGISGSGPATAAAVGGAMTAAMIRAGYPASFVAGVIGAGAATDILIPPSVALILYGVLTPGVSVPGLFMAGIVPGTLAGLALMVPAVVLSRIHGWGLGLPGVPQPQRPPFWRSLRRATPGLMAKVVILGGLRAGIFTPTEAAVVAVAYGLAVGFLVHRTLRLKDLKSLLVESGELSGVILTVVGLASVFAYATATLGVVDPVVRAITGSGLGEYGVMALLILALIVVGMFLDGVSTFLILLPVLIPIAVTYHWNLVWFGVILTLKIAIGQFSPPLAVNLMVSCRIAGAPIESTLRWVPWMILAMFAVLVAVVAVPGLALWLPRRLAMDVG